MDSEFYDTIYNNETGEYDEQFKSEEFLNNTNGDLAIGAEGDGSGSGAFNCNYCPKVFNRKENLSRHIRTHDAEKQFECKFCNIRFTRKQNLNRHMKVKKIKRLNLLLKKKDIFNRIL